MLNPIKHSRSFIKQYLNYFFASYVSHGLIGAKLDDILLQVKNFIRRFTKEVILLDVNHVYAPPKDKPAVLTLLFSKIKRYLGSHLCPRTKLARITLQYLWRAKKPILFFSDHLKNDQIPRYVWSSVANILAPFDTEIFQDPDKWIAFLTAKYKGARPRNILYITQGILLPHWIEVLAGQAVNATLKAWISETASARLVKWIKTRRAGPDGINVVIADFIEDNGFVPAVLSLNSSGRTSLRTWGYLILVVMHVLVYVR